MLPVPRRPRRRPADPPVDGPPVDGPPVDGAAEPELGELVALVADSGGDRRGQLVALAKGLARSGRAAGIRGAGDGVRWLADIAADVAPRIPVRDATTLREHHPGRTDDEIAEALIRTASRATATFGAGLGGLAAVQFAAPPSYLAAPVLLAAETLAVVVVEVKLVAELHELYGEAASGTGSQRGSAYLMSWVKQRALDPMAGAAGLSAVLGHAAKRELRTVLVRRMSRGVTKFAPFLAGAIAGGTVNRRVTRSLGDKLVAELRGRRPPSLRH